jgi:hypothetical protein
MNVCIDGIYIFIHPANMDTHFKRYIGIDILSFLNELSRHTKYQSRVRNTGT